MATAAAEPLSAPAGVDPELAAVVRRLGRLPAAAWDAAAPLYQGPVPVPAVADPITAGRPPDGPRRPRTGPRRFARPPAAVAWAATAAAVVVILAVVGINTFSGQPPQRPVTGVSTVPASWRLAGFIDQMAWQPSSSGAVAASVTATCPTVTNCYADNLGSSQYGAVVEVTTDGGAAWQASPLPAGTWLTSNLTCPTAEECLVAGYAGVPIGAASPSGGTPAIFVTTDGGVDWSTVPLPSQAVEVVSLACRSVDRLRRRELRHTDVDIPAGGGRLGADDGRRGVVVRHARSPDAFVPSRSLRSELYRHRRLRGRRHDRLRHHPDRVVDGQRGRPLLRRRREPAGRPPPVPAGIAVIRAVSCSDDGACTGRGQRAVVGRDRGQKFGPLRPEHRPDQYRRRPFLDGAGGNGPGPGAI